MTDHPEKARPSVREEFIQEEGYRETPYKCSEGHWTVGIGHKMLASELTPRGRPLRTLYSPTQIAALFDHDLNRASYLVALHMPWSQNLDLVRQRVLLQMMFQMGWGDGTVGLSSFKRTLPAIQQGRWQAAHDGMLASKWAKQTPARASRLAHRILTGEY